MTALYANEITLVKPGVKIGLSPLHQPALLKGIKVMSDKPFEFEFILDQGLKAKVSQGNTPSQERVKQEAEQLIKYFLTALTVPQDDLWVNLSPYEKDKIIPEVFGQTSMGRELLAQDYLLKQISASLLDPETELGKVFWDRVYQEAAKRWGNTHVAVSTLNKVWIVPELAEVYENSDKGQVISETRQTPQGGKDSPHEIVAFITKAKLKVMLEDDYLALKHQQQLNSSSFPGANQEEQLSSLEPVTASISKIITQEIIIPILEKEINEGTHFAPLRQIYYSLILAQWYKNKIKDSMLAHVYGDKNKIGGFRTDLLNPQEIYTQYLKSFKKGVINIIREEIDPINQQVIPRKYFSGGMSFGGELSKAMTTVSDGGLIRQQAFSQVVVLGAKLVKIDSIDIPKKELLRDPVIQQNFPKNQNEQNYLINQGLARKAIFRLINDLSNKRIKNLDHFAGRMKEINRLVLIGRGDTVYISPVMDQVQKTRDEVYVIATQRQLQEPNKSNQELFGSLYELLKQYVDQLILSPEVNKEDIVTIEEIYHLMMGAGGVYIFVSGNHSLAMNMVNALLRLNGLNGMSHGDLDHQHGQLPRSEFKEIFIQRVFQANPAMLSQESIQQWLTEHHYLNNTVLFTYRRSHDRKMMAVDVFDRTQDNKHIGYLDVSVRVVEGKMSAILSFPHQSEDLFKAVDDMVNKVGILTEYGIDLNDNFQRQKNRGLYIDQQYPPGIKELLLSLLIEQLKAQHIEQILINDNSSQWEFYQIFGAIEYKPMGNNAANDSIVPYSWLIPLSNPAMNASSDLSEERIPLSQKEYFSRLLQTFLERQNLDKVFQAALRKRLEDSQRVVYQYSQVAERVELLPIFIEHVMERAKALPDSRIVFLRAGAEALYEASRLRAKIKGDYPLERLHSVWATMSNYSAIKMDREQKMMFVKYLYDQGVIQAGTKHLIIVDTDTGIGNGFGTEMLFGVTLFDDQVIKDVNRQYRLNLPMFNNDEDPRSVKVEFQYMYSQYVKRPGMLKRLAQGEGLSENQISRFNIVGFNRLESHGLDQRPLDNRIAGLWGDVDMFPKVDNIEPYFVQDRNTGIVDVEPRDVYGQLYNGHQQRMYHAVAYAGLKAAVLDLWQGQISQEQLNAQYQEIQDQLEKEFFKDKSDQAQAGQSLREILPDMIDLVVPQGKINLKRQSTQAFNSLKYVFLNNEEREIGRLYIDLSAKVDGIAISSIDLDSDWQGEGILNALLGALSQYVNQVKMVTIANEYMIASLVYKIIDNEQGIYAISDRKFLEEKEKIIKLRDVYEDILNNRKAKVSDNARWNIPLLRRFLSRYAQLTKQGYSLTPLNDLANDMPPFVSSGKRNGFPYHHLSFNLTSGGATTKSYVLLSKFPIDDAAMNPTGGIDLTNDKSLTVNTNSQAEDIHFKISEDMFNTWKDAGGCLPIITRVEPLVNPQAYFYLAD